MYVLIGFGVTIGFHRMLTHRSFEAKPWLRATFAILGSMSVQGAVIHWVADHRQHHAFTDEEGDPHSPHPHEGEGVKGVLIGLWHSHMGWLFETSTPRPPATRRTSRRTRSSGGSTSMFPVWVLLGLAIPFVAGFALSGGSLFAGFTAFVWAGLVRVFLLHHATWSVNSICHMYGRRPTTSTTRAATTGSSRSCRSARAGTTATTPSRRPPGTGSTASSSIRPTPSSGVLERLGLVWNVRRPKDEQIAAQAAQRPARCRSRRPSAAAA